MQVHFVLDSVEDRQKIEAMGKATEMFHALWDINQELRSIEKYELEGDIGTIRKFVRETLFDYGINLDLINAKYDLDPNCEETEEYVDEDTVEDEDEG